MPTLDVNNGLTLLELRTRVMALGYGTDVSTQIDVSLNAAQNRVCGIRRWSFLERELVTTIPADSTAVELDTLSTEYHRLDAVRLFDGTDELDIQYVDPEEFRKYQWIYQDEAAGPFYWTRYREALLFQPATHKELTLVVEGVISASPMVADVDRTVIPAEYGEVLVWGAMAYLAFRERDWAARSVAEELFAKHLNAMLTAYVHEQRQNASEVARWEGWGEVGGGRLMWRG